MKTNKLKQIATLSGLMIGAFALSVLAESYVWTPASCEAPNCNVPPPINVGDSVQYKSGGLALGGSSFSNGYAFEVNGPGYFTGLTIAGMLTANSLVVNGVDKDKNGYVLTNNGSGVAEWKPKGGGAVTLSEVSSFNLDVKRNGGLQTFNTPIVYQFCALSRIESEMGRVNAGSLSLGYCDVSKNDNGTWKLSGYLANDPDFKCKMTCFK